MHMVLMDNVLAKLKGKNAKKLTDCLINLRIVLKQIMGN